MRPLSNSLVAEWSTQRRASHKLSHAVDGTGHAESALRVARDNASVAHTSSGSFHVRRPNESVSNRKNILNVNEDSPITSGCECDVAHRATLWRHGDCDRVADP